MEDIKLAKKITEWDYIGTRTKGQPQNRWKDEIINDLKKLKTENFDPAH